MFIYRVTEAFKKHRVNYAIAGGWAVALHGAVRGTVDLDVVLVLSKANLERAERALKTLGLESRLPLTAHEVIQFREEYIRNRNMLTWRFMNASDPTEIVDLLIMEDLRRLRKTSLKLGRRTIPLVAIPDLIQMKKASGRPQDLEDVKALRLLQK